MTCIYRRLANIAAAAAGRSATPLSLSPFHRPITSLVSLQTQQALRKPILSRRASTAMAGTSPATNRKQLVFLGTPEIAALVLSKLIDASQAPDASFEIAAVVAQPGRPRGRNRAVQPSPVESTALAAGLSPDRILCPVRASESEFLDTLSSLQPDLCVTAAYGNYLPTKFLSIPKHGTLNIHPSLLPKYRGAAPVQRSLQDGVPISGVSLLYTVKEMDAGPILAQKEMVLPDDVQAPELLEHLFALGTDLLLDRLDNVWAGSAESAAVPQDSSAATHAAKIQREEGLLNFNEAAVVCHNKVRAFAGWPGTWAAFELLDSEGNIVGNTDDEPTQLKIIKTKVVTVEENEAVGTVLTTGNSLRILCSDGAALEVLEVQAPGRKAVSARDYLNGIKGKTLRWKFVEAAAAAAATAV